jgi:predicted PhzF superfamily epimerase YddE/YHI9
MSPAPAVLVCAWSRSANGSESPFTGAPTDELAAYLWRCGLSDRLRFVAEQGHRTSRPGQASVAIVGPSEAITAVCVGAAAVALIRGELML